MGEYRSWRSPEEGVNFLKLVLQALVCHLPRMLGMNLGPLQDQCVFLQLTGLVIPKSLLFENT